MTETPDDEPLPNRQCGTCFVCCITSGVEAAKTTDRIGLRTYPGQTCVHLDPGKPSKCCSVYSRRPFACEHFHCAWKMGLGTELDRPDQSGIVTTIYPLPDNPQKAGAATIVVSDGSKCGEIDETDRPLRRAVNILTTVLGLSDIKIVNYQTRMILHILDGEIFLGKLHKSTAPEELTFDHSLNHGKPVGRFEIQTVQ